MAKKVKVEKEKNVEIKENSNSSGIISWVFGILFILSGFVNVFSQIIFGSFMILIGLFILPPIKNLIQVKMGYKFGFWKTIGIIFGLMILSSFISAFFGIDNLNDNELNTENSKINIQNSETKTNTYSTTTNSQKDTQVMLSYIDATALKNYDYKDLIRYPEKYQNKYLFFQGKIVQIQESFGKKYARIDLNKDPYDFEGKVIWVEFSGARLVEGDNLIGYFKGNGVETYTAVLGNEITIPKGSFVYIYNIDSKENYKFVDNLIADIDIKSKITSTVTNTESTQISYNNKNSYKYITNLSNSDVFVGLINMTFDNKETWGKIKQMTFYVENPKNTAYGLGLLLELGEDGMKSTEYETKLFKLVDYIDKGGKIVTIDMDFGVPNIENEKIVKLSLSQTSYYFESVNANTKFEYDFKELGKK